MRRILPDNVVVVAGGGRGIGRACALLAAMQGARVVVNDLGGDPSGRSGDVVSAQEVAGEISGLGGQAIADASDIAQIEGARKLLEMAVDAWGRVDAVINMAGILRPSTIFSITEGDWDDVLRVHLKGHFALMQAAAKVMRPRRYGRIVACTSTAALYGQIGNPDYAAAKAGIVGLVRCLSRELGHFGITVNAIAPGARTRLGKVFRPELPALRAQLELGDDEAGAEMFQKMTEDDEAGLRSPEMIAPLAAYLVSPEAWNVNGKVFVAEGRTVGVCVDELPVRSIYAEADTWTVAGLSRLVPGALLAGWANPAPPDAKSRAVLVSRGGEIDVD